MIFTNVLENLECKPCSVFIDAEEVGNGGHQTESKQPIFFELRLIAKHNLRETVAEEVCMKLWGEGLKSHSL